MTLDPQRRRLLLHTLFGAGAIGLRSFASGIPISILVNPKKALAAQASGSAGCPTPSQGQFLILSQSSDGDPVNANVPGTYGLNNILHSADPKMAATSLMLGNTKTTAAAPWASLAQSTLNRTVFFHHATYTVVHGDNRQTQRLDGEVSSNEMLVSMMASQLSQCLGTVQAEPVCVGTAGNQSELLSYKGRSLPGIPPQALASVLTMPTGPLKDLRAVRDETLDKLYAFYKKYGNQGQANFIDRYATSQTSLRSVKDSLLDSLSAVKDNSPASQVTAASTLFTLGVTPVVSVKFPFGGDNHSDNNLAGETNAHIASTGTINTMMSQLASLGLADKVSFLSLNVFGRTMNMRTGTLGRDHNGNHHCAVMIGSGLQGGIVGGLTPMGNNFGATGFDSTTGASMTSGGDVPFTETFGAMGKTIARACGISQAYIDANILKGKVVKSAINPALG